MKLVMGTKLKHVHHLLLKLARMWIVAPPIGIE